MVQSYCLRTARFQLIPQPDLLGHRIRTREPSRHQRLLTALFQIHGWDPPLALYLSKPPHRRPHLIVVEVCWAQALVPKGHASPAQMTTSSVRALSGFWGTMGFRFVKCGNWGYKSDAQGTGSPNTAISPLIFSWYEAQIPTLTSTWIWNTSVEYSYERAIVLMPMSQSRLAPPTLLSPTKKECLVLGSQWVCAQSLSCVWLRLHGL